MLRRREAYTFGPLPFSVFPVQNPKYTLPLTRVLPGTKDIFTNMQNVSAVFARGEIKFDKTMNLKGLTAD